jgi:hypothetical protein
MAKLKIDIKKIPCPASVPTGVATVIAWLASVALAGCGSSGSTASDDSGSSGSTVPDDQACADLAQAQCSRRQACTDTGTTETGLQLNPNGVFIMTTYGDLATCVSRTQLACLNNLAAPDTGISPAQLEKCAAEYATWSCIDLFDNGANPPADCAPPGKRANGVACTFAGQCASRFCSNVKYATCGTCDDQPLDGTACVSSGCAPGQECKTESTGDMLCRDRLDVGSSTCTADIPCKAFSSCVGASSTNPAKVGVCTTTSTSAGATCGGTNPTCENNLGLACQGVTGAKTCQPIAYVQAGAACGTLADGSRAECVDGDCFTETGPAASTDLGTCVAQTADGAPCDTQLGPLCLAPARCVYTGAGTSGICTVPVASMCN